MITLQLIKPPPLSKHSHDTIKTPLRLLLEDRSAKNKSQATNAENLQQPEKTEEIKNIPTTELEKAPHTGTILLATGYILKANQLKHENK